MTNCKQDDCSSKKRIAIWGTGATAKRILDDCSNLEAFDLVGFVDNDSTKWGGDFRGFRIINPDIINKEKLDNIVVLSKFYEEIKKQIVELYHYPESKIEDIYYFYKNSLITRYQYDNDPEIKKTLEYIELNGLSVFNDQFSEKYKSIPVDVQYDDDNRMYYVRDKGKRIYMARMLDTKESVTEYYRSILLEQDEKSPHRYLSKGFDVASDDVVIDAGCAEGNFSLEIIEKASKIYMIESDNQWIEALRLTFRPWMDKIEIIPAFLNDYNEGMNCTLDSIIQEPVNFIKMDIEGYEWNALRGCINTIKRSSELKMAICSYHSDMDQSLIELFFDQIDISHSTTNGYMWFPHKARMKNVSTRLVRGIVRGIKGGK